VKNPTPDEFRRDELQFSPTCQHILSPDRSNYEQSMSALIATINQLVPAGKASALYMNNELLLLDKLDNRSASARTVPGNRDTTGAAHHSRRSPTSATCSTGRPWDKASTTDVPASLAIIVLPQQSDMAPGLLETTDSDTGFHLHAGTLHSMQQCRHQ
jgi:hypothetical protein